MVYTQVKRGKDFSKLLCQPSSDFRDDRVYESIMRTNECDQLVSAIVSALRHFREAPPQVAWQRGTSLRLIECLIQYSATLATDAFL